MAIMTTPFVFHLVIALDHGGLERQVLSWAREREARHPKATTILCLDRIGNLAEEAAGLTLVSMTASRSRIPWDFSAVSRIRHELRKQQATGRTVVLHSHNMAAWQYAVLACMGTGVRLIHTQHGANVHDHGWVNALRARLLTLATDSLVTVSTETALAMADAYGLLHSSIKVIPNGIDVAAYSRADQHADGLKLRAGLGISSTAFVIGSVGRLADIKGQDRLINAFARLLNTPTAAHYDLRLMVVGEGPTRPALEQLLARLKLPVDRVLFCGFQADPRPYLAGMDLFVLPSRSEGLSLALLEAMAMELPVAVTAVGANGSVLGGVTGLVLDSDDSNWPDQLTAEIERIRLPGSESRSRVEAGRSRVASAYSLTASLDQYEALYQAIPN